MTRVASLVALSVLLGACGGEPWRASAGAERGRSDTAYEPRGTRTPYHAPTNANPPSGAPAEPTPASPTAGAEVGPGSGAAAPARREAKRSADAESAERPGLGTSWGETRQSRVWSTPFERSSDAPFATVALYYNDADGVRALTRGAWLSAPNRDGVNVSGGALRVRLLDASGRPLPTYVTGERPYVVGNDGDRYVVEIHNNTSSRFEAVATVDGLDVMDGRAGSFDKRGYVLSPYATITIDGFRRNMGEVAAFRFGSVRESYAARTGDDRNVGVIGVAFFTEQGAREPWMQREVELRNSADPFPGRFAQPPR